MSTIPVMWRSDSKAILVVTYDVGTTAAALDKIRNETHEALEAAGIEIPILMLPSNARLEVVEQVEMTAYDEEMVIADFEGMETN